MIGARSCVSCSASHSGMVYPTASKSGSNHGFHGNWMSESGKKCWFVSASHRMSNTYTRPGMTASDSGISTRDKMMDLQEAFG